LQVIWSQTRVCCHVFAGRLQVIGSQTRTFCHVSEACLFVTSAGLWCGKLLNCLWGDRLSRLSVSRRCVTGHLGHTFLSRVCRVIAGLRVADMYLCHVSAGSLPVIRSQTRTFCHVSAKLEPPPSTPSRLTHRSQPEATRWVGLHRADRHDDRPIHVSRLQPPESTIAPTFD
jgi:hypothetical protein